MRKAFVGFILATAGLIGYFLLVKYAPNLVYERLAILLGFEFSAIIVYYWDRQDKQKREIEKRLRELRRPEETQ